MPRRHWPVESGQQPTTKRPARRFRGRSAGVASTSGPRPRCESTGKVKLARRSARAQASRMMGETHAYACRSCGTWHIGSALPRIGPPSAARPDASAGGWR